MVMNDPCRMYKCSKCYRREFCKTVEQPKFSDKTLHEIVEGLPDYLRKYL
jgi:hypothetical protein